MPKLSRPTRRRRRAATAHPRAGFTLAELMVSLVMFAIVSGIILGMVRSQQRFYRGATEIIDIRSQLRQASALLPLELRSVSTVSTTAPAGSPYQPSITGSDIVSMTDSSIKFRATIGSGIVCKRAAGSPPVITLVPHGTLAKGNVLTSWYTVPQAGDTVFIFDKGVNDGAGDDNWRPYRITDVTSTQKNQCPGSPFITAGTGATGDDDKPQIQFTLNNPANVYADSIFSGSVVRFTRTVGYGLYKTTVAGKDQWYLGYKTMTASGTYGWPATYEPVSGPYSPYTAGGTNNGLKFTYYDSTGAQITTLTQTDKVARVDIRMRGTGVEVGNAASSISVKNKAKFVDSALVRVSIRNRS